MTTPDPDVVPNHAVPGSVFHHDFSLVRTYPFTRAQVFDAWADPAKKARWFGVSPEFHDTVSRQDFRVGGRDHNSATHDAGWRTEFDAEYQNIVQDERIVYSYRMTFNGAPLSASLAAIEFADEPTADGGPGTRMTLTEHGAYYGDAEDASNRELGTRGILDDFAAALGEIYGA
jgi:uncharacterized protein YndB with AHSA1/START domain